MKEESIYLDEHHNVVDKNKAKYLVVMEYDDEGNLQKETWVDLNGKTKDEAKCNKCS